MLPLQPFERLAEVLSSASVLLAVIERDAGEFSVPSKVLSDRCAGKPIVLAAPPDNLATGIVTDSGAGIAVDPENEGEFVAAAIRFLVGPVAARKAGEAGRRYAEEHFRLDAVADRFEAVFNKAAAEVR